MPCQSLVRNADFVDLTQAPSHHRRRLAPYEPELGRKRIMTYQSIDVRKLTPTIGAEIFGVDLGKPLGNQQFQEVHDALMENLVIFFRDQKMTIDQHKDFGRRFGPLHVHPNAPIEIPEHPEILVIKANEKSKHVA